MSTGQNVILVKQNGRRFHDEMDGGHDFFAAAMSWSGDPGQEKRRRADLGDF